MTHAMKIKKFDKTGIIQLLEVRSLSNNELIGMGYFCLKGEFWIPPQLVDMNDVPMEQGWYNLIPKGEQRLAIFSEMVM